MKTSFFVGEAVMLRSGAGPIMYIESLIESQPGQDTERLRCKWLSANKLQTGILPVDSLVRVLKKKGA